MQTRLPPKIPDPLAVELRLPDFDLPGAAVVTAWHAQTAERVVEGQRLVEVTAGDVAIDLAAPASGVLVERCAAVDAPLAAGQVLARIQPQ